MKTTPQPIWTSAGITAAVTALLALFTAFGLELTSEQTAAILGVVNILAQLIVAVWLKGHVTDNAQVLEKVITPGSQIVVAGPANDLIETGAMVRTLSEDYPDDEVPDDLETR